MNSPITDTQQHVDKGKARAEVPEVTERTPLLASGSYTLHNDPESSNRARRQLLSKLTCVFLTSLAVCIILFIVVALLAYSYATRVSDLPPSDFLDSALVVKGPDRVDVLNITDDGGIWVDVQGSIGIDAGSALGVNDDDDNSGLFKDIWKSMGRWGIRRLNTVSINLSTIRISPHHNSSVTLASIDTPPLELPLTANPPPDSSWLTPLSAPLYILPTQDVSDIMQFARESWKDGVIAIQASVGKVAVHGGTLNEHTWRRKFKTERSDVLTSIHMKIPQLPGLPQPGPFPSIQDLVTLKTFDVTSDSNKLLLSARASVVDPAPSTFNFTSPTLPLIISLPSDNSSSPPIPVASLRTQPFSLTHPNITVIINGFVLPLPASSQPTLSSFISRYLSEKDSPIIISTPIFPNLTVDTVFPAPNPRPKVLHDVTIHDMKIKPTGPGGTFLASGTVYARVVLPNGIDIGLDARRVLPDVLIFDGEAPDDPTSVSIFGDEEGGIPAPPLPDPLPPRAFAHIRPDDWLNATSKPDESRKGEGAAFVVTADIEDIPLEVLPGRQREFSNFVSKVIFGSQGAVAGIRGSAAVAVSVHGLPIRNGSDAVNEIELTGLPFKGRVRVGKKSLFERDLERLRRIMHKLPWHGP